MENRFEPELSLEHADRAAVAQTVATPGWKVINRILRSEVDKYLIALINVPASDDHAIVAAHKLSKAAAQVYTAAMSRISNEVQQFIAQSGMPTTPVDITEGLIDLGPASSTIEDLGMDITNDQFLEEGAE
jgi:hypothetical protein